MCLHLLTRVTPSVPRKFARHIDIPMPGAPGLGIGALGSQCGRSARLGESICSTRAARTLWTRSSTSPERLLATSIVDDHRRNKTRRHVYRAGRRVGMEDVNDVSTQADQLHPLAVSVVSALREVGAYDTVTVMLVERLAVLAVQPQRPAPGSIDQSSRSATRKPWASPSRGVRMRHVHDSTWWTACMCSAMRAEC